MSPVIAPGKLMPLMPLPLEPRAFERLTSEELVVMSGAPPSIKEDIEMSVAEELDPGSQGPSQEHLVKAEMMEHGSRYLGAFQRQQKLDPKAVGSAAGQPVWNMMASWSKIVVLYGAFGTWWLGLAWEYRL
ncbi:hypothetical protein CB1_000694003 [Camelus ferus]|nr:hypothetical protein CB1_000694003 [Camelus ferus]